MLSNERWNTPELEEDYYNRPDKVDQLFDTDKDDSIKENLLARPVRFLRAPPAEIKAPTTVQFIKAQEKGRYEYPRIHYGSLASGDRLMKKRSERDAWYIRIKEQTKAKILCFEMEAAGILQAWPCLVVRGICDYCDSHKNDEWQNFAAATAAAYTKDLLYRIAPEEVDTAKSVNNILLESE